MIPRALTRLNGAVLLVAAFCAAAVWQLPGFSVEPARASDANRLAAFFAERPYTGKPGVARPVAFVQNMVSAVRKPVAPGSSSAPAYGMMASVSKGKPAMFGIPKEPKNQAKTAAKTNAFVPTWSGSYQLYYQPHALWLTSHNPEENISYLGKILGGAAKARQVPEVVLYFIPDRDMNQASAGGVQSWATYMAHSKQIAAKLSQFNASTHIRPVIYLEPDSIAHAVQYLSGHQGDASHRLYETRMAHLREVVKLYDAAGADVYLDAGHSDWFGHSTTSIMAMAEALNKAGIRDAKGFATNISNRQKINDRGRGEQAYIEQLKPMLENPDARAVVDTSRNGGVNPRREYYLAPDHTLYDNETPDGRVVGSWQPAGGDIQIRPHAGNTVTVSQLQGQQYEFDQVTMKLTAPPWLDPAGDIEPGAMPTNNTGISVIDKFRWIKPPDEADGSLNYPPGISRHETNQRLVALQKTKSAVIAANIQRVFSP